MNTTYGMYSEVRRTLIAWQRRDKCMKNKDFNRSARDRPREREKERERERKREKERERERGSGESQLRHANQEQQQRCPQVVN